MRSNLFCQVRDAAFHQRFLMTTLILYKGSVGSAFDFRIRTFSIVGLLGDIRLISIGVSNNPEKRKSLLFLK